MIRAQSLLWVAFVVTVAGCGSSKEPVKSDPAPVTPPVAVTAVGAVPSPASAPAPVTTPATIAGTWACKFANAKKESVTEALTFEAAGDAANARVVGVDGAGHHYSGKGKATLTEGTWNMTFTWSNKVSPTWVKLTPAATGPMLGRRGKLTDKNYEADYNCERKAT